MTETGDWRTDSLVAGRRAGRAVDPSVGQAARSPFATEPFPVPDATLERMEPYRVQLDVYNGPLDLLLYLIRRDEVDVYDIPIAHITEQYCRHVELIREVDPNLAGEFLVMAATLLEIKSRMLLPSPPPGEADAAEADLGDPRTDLIRQLLEYKAFKDAAAGLREAGEAAAQRHPRHPARPEFEEPALDLENVQVWHLLEAFGRLMDSIGRTRRAHEVVYDDTPIALHAADIVDRLQRQGSLTFRQVFEGRAERTEIVGLFLAMLELIRQNQVVVQQETVFGEIRLRLREPTPETDQTRGEETMIAFNTDYDVEQLETQSQRNLLTATRDEADAPEAEDADGAALLRGRLEDLRPSTGTARAGRQEEADEDEWEEGEEDLDGDEDGEDEEDEDEEEWDDEEDEGDEDEEDEFEEDEEDEDEEDDFGLGLDDEDELDDDEDEEEDWLHEEEGEDSGDEEEEDEEDEDWDEEEEP